MSLHGAKTILAITGGIAAFKALGVLRLLKRHGADVYVVMTEHATHFLTPPSCEMVSGHPVSVDLFAPLKTWEMEHIALAHGAELVLVVPAPVRAAQLFINEAMRRLPCRDFTFAGDGNSAQA